MRVGFVEAGRGIAVAADEQAGDRDEQDRPQQGGGCCRQRFGANPAEKAELADRAFGEMPEQQHQPAHGQAGGSGGLEESEARQLLDLLRIGEGLDDRDDHQHRGRDVVDILRALHI